MYRFSNQTLGRWTQETLSLPWCWFRIIFVIFNVLKFLFWKACDVGKLEREGLGCKIEGFCHDLFAPSLDFTSASYIVFKNCSLVLYLDLQFFDLICSWSTCPNTVGILRVGYRNFYSQAIFHWGHHADPSTYVASRNTKKHQPLALLVMLAETMVDAGLSCTGRILWGLQNATQIDSRNCRYLKG